MRTPIGNSNAEANINQISRDPVNCELNLIPRKGNAMPIIAIKPKLKYTGKVSFLLSRSLNVRIKYSI